MNLDFGSAAFGVVCGLMLGLAMVLAQAQVYRKRLSGTRPQVAPQIGVRISVELIEKMDINKHPLVAQWFDLPPSIEFEQMVKLATRIVNGDFSFNYSLAGIESGNPVTRGQLDALKPIFLKYEIIKQRSKGNPRIGYVVTPAGRAFFRKWADLPPLSRDELIAKAQEQGIGQVHTDTNEPNE